MLKLPAAQQNFKIEYVETKAI